MTALIFNTTPEQVIIAMDTLAMCNKELRPLIYTSKFYPLPHFNGIMVGTGLGNFFPDWFATLQNNFVSRDIHQLDSYVTPALIKIAEHHEISEKNTCTAYHFGYSEEEKRYVAFAYRSTNNFRSEMLEYGLATKPGVECGPITKYPGDFIAIMKTQKEEDEKNPLEKRVHIGGEIKTAILQDKKIIIETVYRFDDYEEMYQEMCKGVN